MYTQKKLGLSDQNLFGIICRLPVRTKVFIKLEHYNELLLRLENEC